MSVTAKDVLKKLRIPRISVSHIVRSSGKNEDFVSLTVTAPDDEGFTIEEAQIAHKIASRECMEMAYMDALANGHLPRDQVKERLQVHRKNYDGLIKGLEKKYNQG